MPAGQEHRLPRLLRPAAGCNIGHPDEGRPFLHDEPRGIEVAVQAGRGPQVAAMGDGRVALDRSGDRHLIGGDVALDRRVLAHAQHAAADVAALDRPVEAQLALECQRAGDFHVLSQDAFCELGPVQRRGRRYRFRIHSQILVRSGYIG